MSAGSSSGCVGIHLVPIWLAPPGDINLTGLRAEVTFVRGALDKLKIVPDMDHIGLDFEPACLEFYKNKRAVRTASSEQVR